MLANVAIAGYQCSRCGWRHALWVTMCGLCGRRNTMLDVVTIAPRALATANTRHGRDGGAAGRVIPFARPRVAVETAAAPAAASTEAPEPPTPVEYVRVARAESLADQDEEEVDWIPSGIEEFDQVIGGGAPRAHAVLVGGKRGTGKSTLLLQAMGHAAARARISVLYVTGEEKKGKIGARARKVGVPQRGLERVQILECNDVDEIVFEIAQLKPDVVIVDSIQEMRIRNLGGHRHERAESCARVFRELAQLHHFALFLVSQMAKSGDFASNEALQQIVDVVAKLERRVERVGDGPPKRTKFIDFRSDDKNRCGPDDVVGVFERDRATGGLTPVEVLTP